MTLKLSISHAPPPTGSRDAVDAKKRCLVFLWIGQPLTRCEGCGLPYWKHMYEPPVGGARALFRVRQYNPHTDRWLWEPVGRRISAGDAERAQFVWSNP